MEQYVIYIIQSMILIIMAPLFIGIVKRIKAFNRGYKGAPILQVYYDYAKLLKKGRVYSNNSSFITIIGPSLSIAAAITATFLVPVFYVSYGNYLGNVFVVIFLLAIIKFFNTVIGLDCSSTFGGMGSSRELFISMLAEPVMFIVVAFLYMETKSFNVFDMAFVNSISIQYSIEHIIAAAAFFILILAENARMPMDNPETHLELTMIHEAMLLDISGRDLAYLEYASSIKLTVYLTLFINCFAPIGLATEITLILILKSIIVYIAKMLICLVAIAVVETTMAKSRLFRLPEIMAAGFSIGIVAMAINYFI
jgi:formate hydrogenlyase subunit 4